MANYDTKLGEWFKQVEKRAEELLARKRAIDSPQEAKGPADARPQVVSAEISPRSGGISKSRPNEESRPSQGIEVPAARADSSVVTALDETKVVADVAVVEKPEAEGGGQVVGAEGEGRRPALFEDAEIPPVEDFFSFLSRSGEHEPEQEQPPFEIPRDQGRLSLVEGTGTPRPVSAAREAAAEHPAAKPEPPPATVTPAQPPAQEAVSDTKWDRVPQHLHILFDGEAEEIAQHSYKSFKESRTSLIERLLDPSVSLEDAARLLNVCPTTVRRYTNRGVLRHFRTAGNQRRFRLSDVLAFMESKQ
jgi:excisionase family DNA binding protein